MVDDGAAEQLPFALQRDVVGALRRGQCRDDDADDRDRDDHAERHHHAEACPVPSGRLWIVSRVPRACEDLTPSTVCSANGFRGSRQLMGQ